MTKQQFIDIVSMYVQKYAPKYGIEVYSPIIAQACLESAYGTSELAVNANNYFGLKYKANVAEDVYVKNATEQRLDGSYYIVQSTKWCSFKSMESGIEGYFKFINNSRYANLKGVKDPKTYLENIRSDGYATSNNYVYNLMNVIKTNDLTRFDKVENKKEVVNMSLNIVNSIMTKNPCYTQGKTIEVKGLMLHSVGCPQPAASAFIKNWNSPSYGRACVHAFIDANDGKVYKTLPWNHRGWHGGGSSNNTHIGVEMCEPNCIKYTSGSNFTCSDKNKAIEMVTRTYNSAVLLFAKLCKEFKLDPLKKGVIVSHKEGCALGIASNHGDPEHLWKGLGLSYTMDTFRSDVKKAMGTSSTTSNSNSTSNKEIYRVRKSWKDAKSQIGAYTVLDNAKNNCPKGYYVFNSKGEVVYQIENKKEDNKTTFKSYKVKITASTLNVRSGPGTNNKINTTVRKNKVYTIVDEKNGWGLLKSKIGWISLAYTKKC